MSLLNPFTFVAMGKLSYGPSDDGFTLTVINGMNNHHEGTIRFEYGDGSVAVLIIGDTITRIINNANRNTINRQFSRADKIVIVARNDFHLYYHRNQVYYDDNDYYYCPLFHNHNVCATFYRQIYPEYNIDRIIEHRISIDQFEYTADTILGGDYYRIVFNESTSIVTVTRRADTITLRIVPYSVSPDDNDSTSTSSTSSDDDSEPTINYNYTHEISDLLTVISLSLASYARYELQSCQQLLESVNQE
jgi:hypothetical protein